jgi:crotonobetainyl-CoA:carnitine CoA-transferase CaiB-like acyl-CoA transferase
MVQRVELGASPTGPLAGVRIADFTAVYSGPLAATILADQGAEVIKVEPAHGDLMRRGLPKHKEMSSPFLTLNRNKKSLCIDLRDPQGQEIARSLIATSDVVMENFRPGVMDRLGLGYDQFKQAQPKLVYASINGVGPDGPYAKRRVYDAVIQAITGFATLRPNEPPQLVNSLVCDKITSLTAAEAVVAALFQAERSGQGQRVELSMLDANLFFLWSDVMANFTFLDDSVDKMPYADLSLFIRQTSDGYIASMPVQKAEIEGAFRALGLEDLIGDPRFATVEDRMRNRSLLKEITDAAYRQFSTDEICSRLEAHDVPFSKVNLRHEVADDPQIKAMDALWTYEHPVVGQVRQPRPPAQFALTPSNFHAHTARLGEHNTSILTDLGYSQAEITAFEETNIVFAETVD